MVLSSDEVSTMLESYEKEMLLMEPTWPLIVEHLP